MQQGWSFSFVLIVILVAFSQWLLNVSAPQKSLQERPAKGREFMASTFEILSFNQEGHLESQLSIRKMEKDYENAKTKMDGIHLIWITPKEQKIVLDSQYGFLNMQTNELWLMGDVELKDSRQQSINNIKSERFYYSEKDATLQSETPVIAHLPNGYIRADKLVLEKAEKKLLWMGHVKG